ncbi:hypothetical protein SERLA73DRAFT_181856 [Serpula lacrymans var. lacrymans S7.3]|uniref:Steroid 5-alpha reductase C-terminal domain-containing protein n=2 Tax=Serpula lacrymans var. lacrymans TaxID=341189 RepID=F8PYV4_SERL3|nr:uncharacterized protein SERLADRAFT_468246 [Serpula lacrymans var. lacrymans S7.9]EGN99067.1 hypothetical protein SERLA73DRAFT_181856 [Serpula lacrymans var. lacrymans S7.3]EGO24641.1 hypothetical protein SERLADRAFT_468246 [Serpula lacrymans var. lacrymans S7.9]
MDYLHGLKEWTPAFVWPAKFCVATTVASYVLSVVTGNVSQVDRVWTFLPTIYTAYYALMPLWPRASPTPLFPYTPQEVDSSITSDFSPRALLMLAMVTTWMFRLSYNTWRRGLFNLKDEDYRWEILRQKIPWYLFQVFNLTFIAIAQNIILFLLGIPTQAAAAQPHTPLAPSDYVLGTLGFLAIAIEFVADNQQYSFQTCKHSGKLVANDWPGARIRWTPEDTKRGFATRGLWAWSRHPNFLCEQSFWIIINLLPLLSPSSPSLTFPPSSLTSLAPLAPCLVLCTLFFSSTRFSEAISLSKYPVAYAAYQRRVGMFVPLATPLWGFLLRLQGEKDEVDRLIFGSHDAKKSE